MSKWEVFLWLVLNWDPYLESLFIFLKQKCCSEIGVCQSMINHQKFLKMFETKMLVNLLWKSFAVVKLQIYTNSSLKYQLVRRYFEAFISGLERHKTSFTKHLWQAASNVSCICFSFFFNFVNRAGRIWSSDNSCDVMLKRSEIFWSLTWETLARKT